MKGVELKREEEKSCSISQSGGIEVNCGMGIEQAVGRPYKFFTMYLHAILINKSVSFSLILSIYLPPCFNCEIERQTILIFKNSMKNYPEGTLLFFGLRINQFKD